MIRLIVNYQNRCRHILNPTIKTKRFVEKLEEGTINPMLNASPTTKCHRVKQNEWIIWHWVRQYIRCFKINKLKYTYVSNLHLRMLNFKEHKHCRIRSSTWNCVLNFNHKFSSIILQNIKFSSPIHNASFSIRTT